MTKKLSMRRAIFAGTAIAAGIAFAGISDDFEVDNGNSPWTGGTTQEVTFVSTPAGGFPISGDNITHTKVLCIDGEASRSNTGTANGKAQLNFLAYITEESDELPTESMSDVQIAFAAGTTKDTENNTVPLMLYCKAKNGTGTAAWQGANETLNATLELNKWHHIQLIFDYTKGVCQVCVDGVPVVSALGRLKADSDPSDTNAGSWYVLANAPDSTTSYVSGLTMYGTAQVDDVVVQEGSSNKFTGDSGAKIGNTSLSYETLAKYGVNETTITTAKLGSSGLTVAQCLQCGLEPTGSDKFKVTSATQTAADTLQLVFPGSNSAKNGIKPQYQIEWEYVDGNGVTQTPSTNLVDDNLAGGNDGTVTATVAVPNDIKNQKVLKYRLKAVAPSAQ